MSSPLRRSVVRLVRAFALTLAVCALALSACQSRLIWLPGAPGGRTPRDAGLAYEELTLTTPDGERLHAWFLPARGEPRGALLLSHGNAGTIEHRLDLARAFVDMDVAVLLYDYRGYGRSTGSPSEEGTYVDARTAWRELVERRSFAPARVLLYGESLGGAVATQLATEVDAAGLVLQDTFSSLADAAAYHYPWLPVRLLLRVDYDSAAKIERIGAPLLVVHSPQDEVVPFAQGEALFAAAREPKELLVTSGGHNDAGWLAGPAGRARVRAFVERTLP